jgi:hypothetical protein
MQVRRRYDWKTVRIGYEMTGKITFFFFGYVIGGSIMLYAYNYDFIAHRCVILAFAE